MIGQWTPSTSLQWIQSWKECLVLRWLWCSLEGPRKAGDGQGRTSSSSRGVPSPTLWTTPHTSTNWWTTGWKTSWQRTGGQQRALKAKKVSSILGFIKQCHQQPRGGNPSPLVSTSEITAGILCSALVSPVQERFTGVSPVKSHKDKWRHWNTCDARKDYNRCTAHPAKSLR